MFIWLGFTLTPPHCYFVLYLETIFSPHIELETSHEQGFDSCAFVNVCVNFNLASNVYKTEQLL